MNNQKTENGRTHCPVCIHTLMNLEQVATWELVAELKKREGVETHMIGPSVSIKVKADGPAIVLVVID